MPGLKRVLGVAFTEQRGPIIGELYVGSALVSPKPAESDGAFDPGVEIVAGAAGHGISR